MKDSPEVSVNIQSTKEGKLYIETKDFFKQEKIQQLLSKLMNSPLQKELEKKVSSEFRPTH